MGVIEKLKSLFKNKPIQQHTPIKLRFVKTDMYYDTYQIEF